MTKLTSGAKYCLLTMKLHARYWDDLMSTLTLPDISLGDIVGLQLKVYRENLKILNFSREKYLYDKMDLKKFITDSILK